jgi:RimJ/RimL family protein N-acetyltransferase
MEQLPAMIDDGVRDGARSTSDAEVVVRPALAGDALDLLHWRNDPLVRAMSRRHERIDEAAHMSWYAQAVNDPNRLLLIGEFAGKKVGVVRFEPCEAAACEVSITVSSDARGRGIGKQLLRVALSRLFSIRPAVSVVAFARLDNEPSLKLFRALGFDLIDDDGELARFALSPPVDAASR